MCRRDSARDKRKVLKMAKGAPITLKFGSDESSAVEAVRSKYADKIRSSDGWYGSAVINIEADNDGKGSKTLIVKAIKDGFQVYALMGTITDKVTVKPGKFTKA